MNRFSPWKKLSSGNVIDVGRNFTMEHVDFCMATNHRCNICKPLGHLEKCCNKKFPQRQKEMMQRLKNRDNTKGMRRVNYIEESEEESEDAEQLVLRLDGDGCKPFYMEEMICGNYFKAIVDHQFPFLRNETCKELWEIEKW